jgi:hypothetical protein
MLKNRGFDYYNQGLITPVKRPSKNKDNGSNTKMPLMVVPTEGVIFGSVNSDIWGVVFMMLIDLRKFNLLIIAE